MEDYAEKRFESKQERKPSLNLLEKVVRVSFQYEGLVFLAVVLFFIGMQAPTEVGSGYPFVEGLVSAIIYGIGLYLVVSLVYVFCKTAVDAGLWLSWRKYARVIVAILTIVYGAAFIDAKNNPWTLWKRRWQQFESGVEMKRKGRYTALESCVSEQWKSLNEEQGKQKEIENIRMSVSPDLKTVFMVQGRTIFEFGKSPYATNQRLREKVVSDVGKRSDLSESQKQRLLDQHLQPEIVSTVSFFCAPTSKNALWPFNTPNYYAPGEALTDLGERILAARAKKILGE